METISVIQTSWRKLIWNPHSIHCSDNDYNNESTLLEKTALLRLEITVIQKNTPNCAPTHLTEWAAGRGSEIISQVISFFAVLFHLSMVWYSPFSGCVFLSESIKVLIAFNTKIISVTCCLKWKIIKKKTWITRDQGWNRWWEGEMNRMMADLMS